jgi:hypothetical protein
LIAPAPSSDPHGCLNNRFASQGRVEEVTYHPTPTAGIDTAKDKLDVAIHGLPTHFTVENRRPALPAAFRWNTALIALYKRLIAQAKPHKLALIACARKLLIYANTVLQRGSPWTPQPATS